VGHWEGYTVIGAAHQQAIVILVERMSGYAKLCKVPHKSADQVSQAIRHRLKSLGERVKTLTVENGKKFATTSRWIKRWGFKPTSLIRIAVGNAIATKNFKGLLR
jgi:IS30 family transposase